METSLPVPEVVGIRIFFKGALLTTLSTRQLAGRLAVGGGQGGQFGHIHGAAAAQTHDEVEGSLFHHIIEGVGGFEVRLGLDLPIDLHLIFSFSRSSLASSAYPN